jgi:hypothetical protein
MPLDMEYIDNWSLWLDLKILLGTIHAVLKVSGAVWKFHFSLFQRPQKISDAMQAPDNDIINRSDK